MDEQMQNDYEAYLAEVPQPPKRDEDYWQIAYDYFYAHEEDR
jgi:hypothetical protein